MAEPETTAKDRPPIALALAVLALGLLGVASLYLIPLESLLPDGVEVPRALLLLNPAIFVTIASFVGWFAAPRAGLHAPVLEAWLARRPWHAAARAGLLPALGVALFGAATLIAYAAATEDIFASVSADLPQPLLTRMLYGGIAEEVMIRWGLMSLFAFALLKLRLPGGAACWSANVLAALIFGLGHFPVLYGVMPDPPASLLALVLLANAGLGILYGWLFMRRGLECAILAHALTHLFGVAGTSLVLLGS